jgi:hypothetical protein
MPNPIASALATLATSYRDYLLDKQYQQMIDKILSQISQPYQFPQTAPESKVPEVPSLPKIEDVVKELQQKAPMPTGELKPPEVMPSTTLSQIPLPAPVSTAPEPQRPLDITSIISTEEEQINQQLNELMTEYQRQKDNQAKALLELMRNPAFRMMPPERQQAIMQMTALATQPKIDPNMIDYLMQTRENLRRARIESALSEPQIKEIDDERFIYEPRSGKITPLNKKTIIEPIGGGWVVIQDSKGNIKFVNPAREINIMDEWENFKQKYGYPKNLGMFDDVRAFLTFILEVGVDLSKLKPVLQMISNKQYFTKDEAENLVKKLQPLEKDYEYLLEPTGYNPLTKQEEFRIVIKPRKTSVHKEAYISPYVKKTAEITQEIIGNKGKVIINPSTSGGRIQIFKPQFPFFIDKQEEGLTSGYTLEDYPTYPPTQPKSVPQTPQAPIKEFKIGEGIKVYRTK